MEKPGAEIEAHHIWCNYYMRPREGCKLCERLFARYPYEKTDDKLKDGKDLMAKHFSENIVRE